ncbi:MAG TPA: hypothetical protein VFJ19_12930 [Nocardioidaceae bacterium]|nr:hypothetical protein [Nocardioidaceae bacterium]
MPEPTAEKLQRIDTLLRQIGGEQVVRSAAQSLDSVVQAEPYLEVLSLFA